MATIIRLGRRTRPRSNLVPVPFTAYLSQSVPHIQWNQRLSLCCDIASDNVAK